MGIALSIIIVSYNTAAYLRKCLASIYKYTAGITFEVIVVDNASSDGSPEMVQGEFPNVRLHAMKDNLGFTKGNNLGIRASKGEYILMLNPDTEIVDNAFPKIIEFLKTNPQAVCATCRLIDSAGNLQSSAFRYPTVFSKWLFYSLAMLMPFHVTGKIRHSDPSKKYEADWITGAATMVGSEPLKKIGGFDERIFIFNEDVDLCIRLKKETGAKAYYCPNASIIHIGQVSHSGNLFPMRCGFRSTCYYFNKHYSFRTAVIFKTLTRFTWTLTLFALGLLNIATLLMSPKLKRKMRTYFDMINTPADCLSGTT